MEEHLPSIIARIGGVVLLVGLLLRRFAGDPGLWRRRPRRAHRIGQAANVLAIAMGVAVVALAIWAAASFPEDAATGLGIIALIAAWAVVLVLVLAGLEALIGRIGAALGRGTYARERQRRRRSSRRARQAAAATTGAVRS